MAVALIRWADSLRQANSDDMAGTISYLAPVDNASGKIFGKKQKFVAVRRKVGKRQRGCAATGERTTPVTSHEQELREKFAAASAATLTRMRDPNQVAEDQAAFANQKKYATLRGYIFAQEYKKLGE